MQPLIQTPTPPSISLDQSSGLTRTAKLATAKITSNDKKHLCLQMHSIPLFWNNIVTDLVTFTYVQLSIRAAAYSGLNHFRDSLKGQQAGFPSEEPLPANLLNNFLQLLLGIRFYDVFFWTSPRVDILS
jgi:hypothetical protein